ncbi:hypothetical protein TcWFU_003242 [Taenia crassiceps]|uniref:Fork-head domain-containing protein n=1 Tax=Taenia crassiceps TaxID=6207 RepID=A0ABR4QPK0_9CEST
MSIICNRRPCAREQSLPLFRSLAIKETLNAHVVANVTSLSHLSRRCKLPFRYSGCRRRKKRPEVLISLCHVIAPFTGCQYNVEDLATEDLHPLTWLQKDNLIPIAPIDCDVEESNCAFDWNSHFGYLSYAQIAFLAIEAVPRKACTLMEIVFWCMQNFPGKIGINSWKLHMSHVLVSNRAFISQTFSSFSDGEIHCGSLWTCASEHREELLQSLRHVMQQRNFAASPGVQNILQVNSIMYDFHVTLFKRTLLHGETNE